MWALVTRGLVVNRWTQGGPWVKAAYTQGRLHSRQRPLQIEVTINLFIYLNNLIRSSIFYYPEYTFINESFISIGPLFVETQT